MSATYVKKTRPWVSGRALGQLLPKLGFQQYHSRLVDEVKSARARVFMGTDLEVVFSDGTTSVRINTRDPKVVENLQALLDRCLGKTS